VASSEQRPASPALATVEGDRITTAKPIVFNEKNDTINLPESVPVLDAVAVLLRSNPALRIEIRAHIDKADDMGYGRSPSQVRARGVMNYLIERGVDADRLTAKGYGATQPLTRGKTPEERAQNRRIELVLQAGH
jgi:outer membrane protein OmpA-like peptidoglycan-associated protein